MDAIENLKKNPSLSLSNNPLAKWDVALEPLQFSNGGRTKFHALRCTDNDEMVGQPVTARYGLIDNAKMLEVAGKASAGTGLVLVNAGSVANRGKTFLQFQIPQMFKGAGREMEAFLNLLNPLDQSGRFTSKTSNNWLACQNSYNMDIRQKGQLLDIRIRHTINRIGDIENLPQLIDAAVGVQAEFALAMDELANVPVKGQDAARNVFAGFLVQGKTELSTTFFNTSERLASLFAKGAGQRGTDAADLFGAITDLYSHEVPGKDKTEAERFEFSEFTTGQQRKANFWEEIWNEKESRPRASRIKELHAEGAKVLKEYASAK